MATNVALRTVFKTFKSNSVHLAWFLKAVNMIMSYAILPGLNFQLFNALALSFPVWQFWKFLQATLKTIPILAAVLILPTSE